MLLFDGMLINENPMGLNRGGVFSEDDLHLPSAGDTGVLPI